MIDEDNTAFIEDINPGTVVQKLKGNVKYIILHADACKTLLKGESVPWYPTETGFLSRTPSKYFVPVDRGSLTFTLRRHRNSSLEWARIVLALHNGRVELFTKGARKYRVLTSAQVEAARDRKIKKYTSRTGTPLLYIVYACAHWTKNSAWQHLIRNPPEEIARRPGVSKADNPYRASHDQASMTPNWCWIVAVPRTRFSMLDDETVLV